MDTQVIKDKIKEKFSGIYPEKNLEIVLSKIGNLHFELRKEFEKYLETDEIPSREVEGYTIEKLMKEHNMNGVAAFLTMDWLIRDPKNAVTSLSKGHEVVD